MIFQSWVILDRYYQTIPMAGETSNKYIVGAIGIGAPVTRLYMMIAISTGRWFGT
jgi:hypothetical protein